MIVIFILLFGTISLLTVLDFFCYLFNKTRLFGNILLRGIEVFSIIILPAVFLFFDVDSINDCCSATAFFSPQHRLTIYVLILLSSAAYFFSSWRTKLVSPFRELLTNCFLLIGIVLNILMCIHETEGIWLIGNVPVIALFGSILIKNYQLLSKETLSWSQMRRNLFSRIYITVLGANVFIKYPLLLAICLPLLLLLSTFLFVFGQQPNSAIKAFTETYKHGLSQLDYMCDNVECGGHYLCSVAANGHSKIVKPQRYGERNGRKIICNRQLLISNAFEELIEQRFPRFHKKIRKKYDRVGDFVHRYYDVFNNKFFSDFIYVVMKPLEWFFLVVLYLMDREPENRIAQQYLSKNERLAIKKNCLKNG